MIKWVTLVGLIWRLFFAVALLAILLPLPAEAIITGSGSVNVNQFLGAERFYNAGYTGTQAIQANIEAGHVWNGHQTLGHVTTRVTGSGAAGIDDSHATRVAAAMGGRRTPESGVIYPDDLRAWGIAYNAQMWSGAIATTLSSDGTFNATNSSVASTYRAIILDGVGGQTADVINSSWVFDDQGGTNVWTRGVDGLINATEAVVVLSAGNYGPGSNTVRGIGAGYNSITVAALAFGSSSNPYTSVANFSSRGPNDFAMATGMTSWTTIAGVRAAVDIAAPGQTLTLATLNSQSNPTAYSTNSAGTSFAAPLIAGGASLIVDAGKQLYGGNSAAIDGRIVKAALLNSADKTADWNNGQVDLGDGLIRTIQSLDWATGAGRMNLDRAFDQYVSTTAGGMAGTTDLPGLVGGNIAPVGWDLGFVNTLGTNNYIIDQPLIAGSNFTATLTWFADRTTGTSNFTNVREQHLANLDLRIVQYDDLTSGNIIGTVAESVSLYNVVEHLSFLTPATGFYGIQVSYVGAHWNFSNENGEFYGLAWSSTPLAVLPGERIWMHPGGGSFGTADNWDPVAVPESQDTAVFDLNGSYVVTFSLDPTNLQLRIGNDVVTFALNGHTYALTSDGIAEPSVRVGAASGDAAQLILSGGTLLSVDTVLADDVLSTGQIVVGTGAMWTNTGHLLVGRLGVGTLTVENGGAVSTVSALLGDTSDAAGYVTVTGPNSAWTNIGDLVIASAGFASATIENGGYISTAAAAVASENGATGSVLVTGAGSKWQISESLFVGGSSSAAGGEGTLDITNGGAVTVADTLKNWTTGTINLVDGTLHTTTLDLTEGMFDMSGGRLLVDTVVGDLNLAAGILARGELAMSQSISGVISITGDYTQQSAATLELTLSAGMLGGASEVLDVGGVATLDGTLVVSLLDDILPAAGEMFDIITSGGGITGAFVDMLLPGLTSDLVWRIFYESNAVSLLVGLSGDFNGDGIVDIADYVVWRQTDGTEAGYIAWSSNFGNSIANGGGSSTMFMPTDPTAVPEPTMLVLCLIATCCLALWPSRRRAFSPGDVAVPQIAG